MALGKAKLGVISEPQASQVVQKNHNLSLLMDLNHEWTATTHTPMPQTAFLASASALEKYPKQVEKILAACERSTLWVNQYPDSAAVLLVRHEILDGTDVAVGRSKSRPSFCKSRQYPHPGKGLFASFLYFRP